MQMNRRIEIEGTAGLQYAPNLRQTFGVGRRGRPVWQRFFPVLERLIAEHDVERGVRERNGACLPIPSRAKLRHLAPIDERLDTSP
jgi:hypothetical protein